MTTITSVEAIPVRIKQDHAYLGALPSGATTENYFRRPPYRALYSAYFETAFVKVTTSDGVIGWGEALAPVAPEVVTTIVSQLLAPVLRGENPLAGDYLWSMMYDLMRERGYYGGFMLDAISACDIALWDVRGKLLNQPVSALLGGPYRKTIPCYVSGLAAPDEAARIALAQSWLDKGFNKFKLHEGRGTASDVAVIAALRHALGDSVVLMLDAHWNYTLDEAVVLGHRLEALNTALFEAPLNPEDIDGHARLAQQVAIPIGIGETERTRYQFKAWLVQGAADILQPDVGRAGISETVKIAQMAEAFNIPVAPHLSVGLGVCVAASLHVAASIPNLWMLEFQPSVFSIANSLLETPLVCEAGQYRLPNNVGLGVTLGERKLRDLQS
jgi:galactonate dehydratase